MQCDIIANGRKTGVLKAERQGLYTRFYGEVNTKDITKVYAVFEGGECALGIPVPEKGKMVLRVSMPTAKLPKGKLLSGYLPSEDSVWQPFPGGTLAGVCYPEGMKNGNALRFPWHVGEKLPAEEVLLFYRYREQEGCLELRLEPDGTVDIGTQLNHETL